MERDEEIWRHGLAQVAALRTEIAKVVVGQETVVEEMLVALLCKGHCLIVGVPGLAKTLLVSTLGKILGLSFRRIQFTPDMMPSDILGCEILQESPDGGARRFEFVRGPVFAHLILADEINRTPPKTQAALLEAMQERQVTVAGRSLELHEPFVVFATQNPIEHEGTYPLPEAQLDRFFFSLNIGYPNLEEERQIVLRTTGVELHEPTAVVGRDDVLKLQAMVAQTPLPEHVLDYILRLVHSTRPESPLATEQVRKYVAWGAGPRASQNIAKAAKAMALLGGNPAASVEDARKAALPALRHRVIPNYNAVGEGVGAEELIQRLLDGAK